MMNGIGSAAWPAICATKMVLLSGPPLAAYWGGHGIGVSIQPSCAAATFLYGTTLGPIEDRPALPVTHCKTDITAHVRLSPHFKSIMSHSSRVELDARPTSSKRLAP